MSNTSLGTSKSWLQSYASSAAQENGIPEDMFFRFIDTESSWDPNAMSDKGAQGIAQIVPKYHPDVNTWDPFESMSYAARLLRSYFDKYGDWNTAFAAYNAGPGNVAKYGGVPPFEETQNYVKKIVGPNLSLANGAVASNSNIRPMVTFVAFSVAVLLIIMGFGAHKNA